MLGPPKISFASSKQAIKTKFDEEQSKYMMSSRRVLKQVNISLINLFYDIQNINKNI